MSRTPTRLAPLAILGIAGVALAGCSSSAAPADASDDGATITVYTSEPEEKMAALVDAFTVEHPEVSVEVFRAGTGDLTTRIAAEQESGDGVQADILLAADAATFEGYAADDQLLAYTPADIEAINPDVVDPEGFYTGTRIIPTVIAYNTSMIDEAPASWRELTGEEYADRIVMPNPDVSGAAAYNAAVWSLTPELGDAWMTELAKNAPVIADSNGPVSQAVATGAQPVGVVVDYLVRELAEQGSPIAVSYPEEGVPFVSQPAGIFTNTDEPEASKLFVDFLVSEAGQKLAVDQSYLPVRGDVGTPDGAPSMDEITILNPALEDVQATQDAAVETFRSLFL